MRTRPLPLTLCAANLAVAALALWPWIAPVDGARVPAASQAAREDAPPLASLPPAQDFAAIAARPLFSPTRRPDAAASTFAGGLSARYRLLGVILAREKGHVLLAPVSGGRAIELGEGDALEGWTLKRIEQNSAVFSSPAGEATLAVTPPR